MSEELKTLKNIEQKLDQLLKWSKFAGMQQLRNLLMQNLTTDAESSIYELSDGERTTREIAGLANIGSNATVASYWRKWSKVGIVELSKRQGRFRRICSLEEVGLTVPPMLRENNPSESANANQKEDTDEQQE